VEYSWICHNKVEVDRVLVMDVQAVISWILVSHVERLWLWQLDTA